MNDEPIDVLLARSAPRGVGADPGVEAHLRAVVTESRAASPRAHRSKKMLWFAAPALLVPAVALGLTAGVEPRLVPDYVIPISYTTDTGRTLECELQLFNGEIDYRETEFTSVDYLRTQDWTGIGQRLYDRATDIVESGDPALSESSDEGVVPSSTTIEAYAWTFAENDLILHTIPESAGINYGSFSTCTRELH